MLAEVDSTIEFSRPNTGMGLCLAINYGARAEIVDAVREIARKVESGLIDADEVTEEVVSSYLYTAGIVDPDLVIRTAGEMRVSNFCCGKSVMRSSGSPRRAGPTSAARN